MCGCQRCWSITFARSLGLCVFVRFFPKAIASFFLISYILVYVYVNISHYILCLWCVLRSLASTTIICLNIYAAAFFLVVCSGFFSYFFEDFFYAHDKKNCMWWYNIMNMIYDPLDCRWVPFNFFNRLLLQESQIIKHQPYHSFSSSFSHFSVSVSRLQFVYSISFAIFHLALFNNDNESNHIAWAFVDERKERKMHSDIQNQRLTLLRTSIY